MFNVFWVFRGEKLPVILTVKKGQVTFLKLVCRYIVCMATRFTVFLVKIRFQTEKCIYLNELTSPWLRKQSFSVHGVLVVLPKWENIFISAFSRIFPIIGYKNRMSISQMLCCQPKKGFRVQNSSYDRFAGHKSYVQYTGNSIV